MITSSNEEGYANYQYQYQAYNNYGWRNTTSQDYHAHVSRSPSVVTDFPRYPNVHKIFNNKQVTCEDKTPPRRPHKKVHFVNQDKTTQADEDNNENGKNVYGGDNSIDAKADGFIKQNHHKFELAKWETFKSLMDSSSRITTSLSLPSGRPSNRFKLWTGPQVT